MNVVVRSINVHSEHLLNVILTFYERAIVAFKLLKVPLCRLKINYMFADHYRFKNYRFKNCNIRLEAHNLHTLSA